MMLKSLLVPCVILAVSAAAWGAGADLAQAPDGVAVLLQPNGGFQITSVGTGAYDLDDPDDVLAAQKEAVLKAKTAIAKFLKEDLATSEGMDQNASKVKRVTSDGVNQSVKVDKTTVKTTFESIHNSSSALLTGVVVLKSAKVPGSGSSGTYRVMVGVSSKTTVVAAAAANGIAGSLDARGAVAPIAPGPSSSGPAAPSDVSGVPAQPGWITCVGTGSDRPAAVQAALVEGISQVYGELLQHDARMSERSKKFKANMSVFGKQLAVASRSATKEAQSDTLTKTAGFVREYRIIKVESKGGNLEAVVSALIVNPRAGGTVALLVKKPSMTIQDRTAMYQLGPKVRMSGAEVAQAIQFALPAGLAHANRFLILNDDSMSSLVENRTQTETMVANGLVAASELMQAGQGLTPDYSITSTLKDILYSKTLGMDPQTGKFGSVYKFSMKLDVTLMNERNGQVVKTGQVTLVLANDEIAALLRADEDADLLQAALGKLTAPIEEWIKGAK